MNKRATQEIVGPRMRELRKAKGLTLKQLAKITNLSIGYLSQLERQDADPSVRSLSVISKALGVPINWFFLDPETEADPESDIVVRAKRRRALRLDSGIRDELLFPSLSGQLEMIRTTFAPGASAGATLYSHKGEEGGIVVEGELELTVEERVMLLSPGDSFHFKSTRPDRDSNPGEIRAVLVWAITPPFD